MCHSNWGALYTLFSLSCLQLEVQDRGDEAVAASADDDDDDAHLEGPRGTQPQDGQAGGEFEDEKRLGQERRAQVMARFIQARRAHGLGVSQRAQ